MEGEGAALMRFIKPEELRSDHENITEFVVEHGLCQRVGDDFTLTAKGHALIALLHGAGNVPPEVSSAAWNACEVSEAEKQAATQRLPWADRTVLS